MQNEIQIFLYRHGLDDKQVAKVSGIDRAQILNLGKSFNEINLIQLQALGMINNFTPDRVLKELIEIHGHPVINFIQAHPRMNRQLVNEQPVTKVTGF